MATTVKNQDYTNAGNESKYKETRPVRKTRKNKGRRRFCLTIEGDSELGHAVLREGVLDGRVGLPDLERSGDALGLARLRGGDHLPHEAARESPLQLAPSIVHLHGRNASPSRLTIASLGFESLKFQVELVTFRSS
jgi:hypothetical protein